MATTHTAVGKFLNYYRALDRARDANGARLRERIPVLLSEGDSWFSTPLYYNLVDWLEVASPDGAFLRTEASGDLATRMFSASNLSRIASRLKAIEFDALLISAGGNDLVDEFLAATFAGAGPMTVDQAFNRVQASGRFDEVRLAYEALINTAVAARPGIRILAHSYDYLLRMGAPAQLSIEQIGLVALFKRKAGDWIARHVQHALASQDDQRAFARQLIDHFHEAVLKPLHKAHPNHFHFVDLRGLLLSESDWNDEMHPTADAFQRLANPYREALRALLPANKRAALG
jgi:lysophospholipase L1-like esterase